MSIFLSSFGSLFQSVLMIFLIAFVAGLLIRKNVLTQEHIKGLSILIINLLLPCLIFSKITQNLNPSEFPIWWIVPLIALATTGIGFGTAWLMFIRQLPLKRNLLPLTAIMNAAYFVLPIGQVIYPGQFDEFALYVALYVMGISPLVWTVGKFFITERKESKTSWKEFMTPPFLANVVGLIFVLTGLIKIVPSFVERSIDLIGTATVPVATIILGATLGTMSWKIKPVLGDLIKVASIKLILVPLVLILILLNSELARQYPLLADLLILEASAPAATALIIQIRRYGGDHEKAGSVLLFSYLACLVLIPLWLALWSAIQ